MAAKVGTYEWWAQFLEGRDERRVARHTVAYRFYTGEVTVYLAGAPIYTIDLMNRVTLRTPLGRTALVKERLNRFLPAGVRIYQERRTWYIEGSNGTFRFESGVQVDTLTGEVLGAQAVVGGRQVVAPHATP